MRKLLLVGGLLFLVSGVFGEIKCKPQVDYGVEHLVHYEDYHRSLYYGQDEISLERPYISCNECLSGLIASMSYMVDSGEDDLNCYALRDVEGCAEILREYKYVSYLRYEYGEGWLLWEFFLTGPNKVFVKVWLDR